MCLANRKPEKRPKPHANTESRWIASRGSAHLAVSDAHIALQGPGYLTRQARVPAPRRNCRQCEVALRDSLVVGFWLLAFSPHSEAVSSLCPRPPQALKLIAES